MAGYTFNLDLVSGSFGRRPKYLGRDRTTCKLIVCLLFAYIEASVSSSEQADRVMTILRKDGDSIVNPDRRTRSEGPSVLFDFPRDSFGQQIGALPLGLGKNDCELVAARPTRNVRPAKGLAACAGDAT